MATPGRKLYFNVTLSSGVTSKFFRCTNTGGFAGDRYGSAFDPLAPLTAGSPVTAKRRNSAVAVFQPSQGGSAASGVRTQLRFVGIGAQSLTGVPSTTSGPIGSESVGTRQFGVRVLGLSAAGTWTIAGTLHVQRQHSIEV